MDDLERLHLLRNLLIESHLSTASSLGKLANGIESILVSIEDAPDSIRIVYSTLWDALEVLGVQHQEAGTEPTTAELEDLYVMANRLREETEVEITSRGG